MNVVTHPSSRVKNNQEWGEVLGETAGYVR